MPKVGGKHFGYGKEGRAKAKRYARTHGLKVKHKPNPGYYAESAYHRIKVLLEIKVQDPKPSKSYKPATGDTTVQTISRGGAPDPRSPQVQAFRRGQTQMSNKAPRTQSQADMDTIRGAGTVARHGGKVAGVVKAVDVALDVASVATGGLGALGKRLVKKAVVEPAITAGKKYYKKKVAGAIGRTSALMRKALGMGGGTDTASSTKKAKEGARPAPPKEIKSTPVSTTMVGTGDEDKAIVSKGTAGRR
mgnify:CR=1 FL=1